jgi:sugar phosphate isomerase/epimerase
MRLGLDTYSLRWQGWDAFQLLEYAAGLGLDNVQFSERGALASLDRAYLEVLKRRAEDLGLTVELGMLSFDHYSSCFRAEYGSGEQQLADLVRAAHVVGSHIVRCVLGAQVDRLGPVPFQQHIDEFLRVLRIAAPLARDMGVKIAVENHGAVDFLARELRSLVETAGTDVIGVCLDTGNPAYAAEDPVVSTEILVPHVIATQVRDTRVWAVADGAMAQWTPMGQGNVNMRRIRDILFERAPNVAFNLEIITCYPPTLIPYAHPESDFWRAYPDMLARDFARFLALAHGGVPEPLGQVTLAQGLQGPPPGPGGQELRDQQRRHFEESVAYTRGTLGLGERARVPVGGGA